MSRRVDSLSPFGKQMSIPNISKYEKYNYIKPVFKKNIALNRSAYGRVLRHEQDPEKNSNYNPFLTSAGMS